MASDPQKAAPEGTEKPTETAEAAALPSNVKPFVPSRDQILAAEDQKREKVGIPEWGGPGAYVIVKGMTGDERDSYEATILEQKKSGRFKTRLKGARAKLVVRCVVDDEDKPLFTVMDVDRLGQKNAAVLDRIWEVAARLSGLKEDDLEELVGDFDSAPSA